jgi:hypothetical protein
MDKEITNCLFDISKINKIGFNITDFNITDLNLTDLYLTNFNITELTEICKLYNYLLSKTDGLTKEILINACITTSFCFVAIVYALYCSI